MKIKQKFHQTGPCKNIIDYLDLFSSAHNNRSFARIKAKFYGLKEHQVTYFLTKFQRSPITGIAAMETRMQCQDVKKKRVPVRPQ